jgi:hypothetical protein
MTTNILSYFINKSPLYTQINNNYYIEIRYNKEPKYIIYKNSNTILNYDKNIINTKTEISTKYIRRVYVFNYKAIYYKNDNYIREISNRFINYNFNNKNKYLKKSSIVYVYAWITLYQKKIFYIYNCKYMKKTQKTSQQYYRTYIFIGNKYELLYYSNIFLIVL